MSDTPYTQGFKAGMAWREAEIIKLLEKAHQNKTHSYTTICGYCKAIELIEGEEQCSTTSIR